MSALIVDIILWWSVAMLAVIASRFATAVEQAYAAACDAGRW